MNRVSPIAVLLVLFKLPSHTAADITSTLTQSTADVDSCWYVGFLVFWVLQGFNAQISPDETIKSKYTARRCLKHSAWRSTVVARGQHRLSATSQLTRHIARQAAISNGTCVRTQHLSELAAPASHTL
jgi:hypothetical protein